MQPTLILQPFVVVMLLTFAVWLRLYFTRIPAMRRLRVHPQKLATREGRREYSLGDTEAKTSDNFTNLFELPVIFYATCLAVFASGQVDVLMLVLAWAFAALRIAHSVIHLTYNTVVHRFVVYVGGGVILFAMVIRFAVTLI